MIWRECTHEGRRRLENEEKQKGYESGEIYVESTLQMA